MEVGYEILESKCESWRNLNDKDNPRDINQGGGVI